MIQPKGQLESISSLWRNAFSYRYYLLLISLLLTLIIPVLTQGQQEGFFWTISRSLVLIACVNVLRRRKPILILTLVMAVFTLTAEWFSFFNPESGYSHLPALVLFGFFVVMISIEVFKNITASDQIDMHIIVGAFCGFMLIGMIASLVFTFLHLMDQSSFSNISAGMEGANEILYFSFITILTIGYGDIAPLTEEARSISVFFGLVGQFYLVVIMAVLVGKFLSKQR